MGILTVPTANSVQPEAFELRHAIFGSQLIAAQQLATIAGEIQQITRDAKLQIVSRDKADLRVRLEQGSWCVAECLDHLTQTTRSFLPAMSDAIVEAPKLPTNRRLRTGILPSLFIRNLNPPYRLRFKVLPQLTPRNVDAETAWADFVESQSQLLETVLSAAGLAIDRVTIQSPVYARISYHIYGAFRMLAAHQSRHIWQIGQILKAVDSRSISVIA
jgi:hypothetical protein